eukprot:TRINITY_DN20576_c0_g1_i1.p1 TRINITY_DN20576_c0_g1~~TRINITY_DN20576_c0_g1_i1.p1  ORF type:complete len:368 (+),score=32.31 TRINITY_DN20576_c0_g1_i1:36-1139(+)
MAMHLSVECSANLLTSNVLPRSTYHPRSIYSLCPRMSRILGSKLPSFLSLRADGPAGYHAGKEMDCNRLKCYAAASDGSTGDPVRDWIMTEGRASKITRISPVAGGCINVANRYDTDAGSFFVKTNRDVGPAMFEAEACGLEAMFRTGAIRVPKPLKVGPLPRRGSFIIMEFIEFGASKGGQAELGRRLAQMHKAGTTDRGFGFDVDNTIGSTPQKNTWTSNWVDFFRDERLGYQLHLAREQYLDTELYSKGQELLARLPDLLGGLDVRPALLHGDLWSGNITADREGNPVILDPATYYGHSEAEFGMSWCAGFGQAFYNAYFEVLPKEPGFQERAELYKLYHYLNHYNLFGSGYRSSCMSIISRFT